MHEPRPKSLLKFQVNSRPIAASIPSEVSTAASLGGTSATTPPIAYLARLTRGQDEQERQDGTRGAGGISRLSGLVNAVLAFELEFAGAEVEK